jgi:hypothetical protein
MQNQTIRDETKRPFDLAEQWVDSPTAARAAESSRVVFAYFPRSEEITHDAIRVQALIAKVTAGLARRDDHTASIYRRGSESVLLIEHHH